MSKTYWQVRHVVTRGCLSFDYWRPAWTRKGTNPHIY